MKLRRNRLTPVQHELEQLFGPESGRFSLERKSGIIGMLADQQDWSDLVDVMPEDLTQDELIEWAKAGDAKFLEVIKARVEAIPRTLTTSTELPTDCPGLVAEALEKMPGLAAKEYGGLLLNNPGLVVPENFALEALASQSDNRDGASKVLDVYSSKGVKAALEEDGKVASVWGRGRKYSSSEI